MYVGKNLENKLSKISTWTEEKEEERSNIIGGGDFNVRTEDRGGVSREEDGEG